MAPDDPANWARTIADELTVGGQRVPFERVLARHLATLKILRLKTGLTWNGVAALLVRAGARRSDGNLISADQIRVGYARLTRPKDGHNQSSESSKPAPKLVPHQKPVRVPASTKSRPKGVTLKQVTASEAAASRTQVIETKSTEDLSDDELTAALARLTK